MIDGSSLRVQESRMSFHLVSHPVIKDRLTRLRDTATGPEEFRRCIHQITRLLTFEATRSMGLRPVNTTTPLATVQTEVLERPVIVVPILRAGLGMMQGVLDILPEASVGHIGLCRNEETHRPEQYYAKFPPGLSDAEVLLVDPMLATGHSAASALTHLQEAGASRITLLSIIAAPEGVAHLTSQHPEIPCFCAALDDQLNSAAFITPGLGDAGDRYFGTL